MVLFEINTEIFNKTITIIIYKKWYAPIFNDIKQLKFSVKKRKQHISWVMQIIVKLSPIN